MFATDIGKDVPDAGGSYSYHFFTNDDLPHHPKLSHKKAILADTNLIYYSRPTVQFPKEVFLWRL
jgi:hypothetical protein